MVRILAWSALNKHRLLGQVLSDNLMQSVSYIPQEIKVSGKSLIIMCLVMAVNEPAMLANLITFKTCSTVWNKTQSLFANDIQRLNGSAQKLASLKQLDHDKMVFVTKAQVPVEELKMFSRLITIKHC